MRKIKLEPGSDDYCLKDPTRVKIKQTVDSTELWVSITSRTCDEYNIGKGQAKHHPSKLNLDGIERVIVTDWQGTYHQLHDYQIEWVEQLNELVPTQWLTMNNYVDTKVDWKTYGWCWNRTKAAYTLGEIGPKYGIHAGNYVQYPFYSKPRGDKLMILTRQNYPYRQQLDQFAQEHNSCLTSNIDRNQVLLPNFGTVEDIINGLTAPPAKKYFDSSYVSCQVESQHLGKRGVLFSEKTYDHLIQGRCVLNFGSAGFYKALQAEGWALPSDLDFSWDIIEHDRHRFQGYLDMLERLLCMPDIHDWFMSHQDVWLYNQQMLWRKPFDIIE